MVRFKIKVLTRLEYLCINISAVFNRLGTWCKRKRWHIEEGVIK